jgi:hypothetical protein
MLFCTKTPSGVFPCLSMLAGSRRPMGLSGPGPAINGCGYETSFSSWELISIQCHLRYYLLITLLISSKTTSVTTQFSFKKEISNETGYLMRLIRSKLDSPTEILLYRTLARLHRGSKDSKVLNEGSSLVLTVLNVLQKSTLCL